MHINEFGSNVGTNMKCGSGSEFETTFFAQNGNTNRVFHGRCYGNEISETLCNRIYHKVTGRRTLNSLKQIHVQRPPRVICLLSSTSWRWRLSESVATRKRKIPLQDMCTYYTATRRSVLFLVSELNSRLFSVVIMYQKRNKGEIL